MRRLPLFISLLVGLVMVAGAQSSEPSDELLGQMTRLEAETMALRGLSLSTPIERLFPARDVVAAFVAGQLEDPAARQYYIDSGLVYEAFDLLEPETDILAVLEELLVSQIGGYYDPDAKTMNTLLISGGGLTDRLPLLEQIVYVHEFTHALQDANFDMKAFLGGDDDIAYAAQHPDEALARLALIEGDATEVMTRYTLMLAQERPQEVLLELEALMGLVSSLEIPPGTPKILEQELTFPYIQGQVFVQRLFAEGGWDLVNEAFVNPPASTEQIINPAKYISGEPPVPVSITDPSDVLGAGWEQRFYRTGGEFFLRRFLETQIDAITVVRAAGGWGGDSYRFFVSDAGQSAWTWQLAWDTSEDSEQFYQAMLDFIESKYPGQLPEFSLCWNGAADAMCLGRLGGDIIVTRAPTRDLAAAMRDHIAPVDAS